MLTVGFVLPCPAESGLLLVPHRRVATARPDDEGDEPFSDVRARTHLLRVPNRIPDSAGSHVTEEIQFRTHRGSKSWSQWFTWYQGIKVCPPCRDKRKTVSVEEIVRRRSQRPIERGGREQVSCQMPENVFDRLIEVALTARPVGIISRKPGRLPPLR